VKKREKNICVTKRRNGISGVCEKNVVDWASNDLDTITIESCKIT
jgi:hypothetical protein